MNICIIGDGLTSMSLARILIEKKINVHIYEKKKTRNLLPSRTIGISKNNLEFFKKELHKIPSKIFWKIKTIEIYSEKLKKEKVLKFKDNKKDLFYTVRNDELYSSLKKDIDKSRYFKKIEIKKNNFYEELLKKKKYDLIINCDCNNYLSKKYFTKKINKDYNNLAYTTILKHKKIINNTATQIFTKFGPIAFLPISSTETSVVLSLDTKNRRFNEGEVISLINKYNLKYKIKKILQFGNFNLQSSNLRNYYYKNILAFGDLLHKLHPLAGQGFNMNIRDIKVLSRIIQNKIDLGMQLDTTILNDFEEEVKGKNFIFSIGIDFIYEFFNFEKKVKSHNLSKMLKIIGKNKNLTNKFIKVADAGLNF